MGKETYIILFLGFIVFLICFDFNELLNLKFFKLPISKLILSTLFFLLLFSILVYNNQELTHQRNLLRLICYFIYFQLFFIFIPRFFVNNPAFFEKFIKFIANLGFWSALFGFFTMFNHPYQEYNGMLLTFIIHPNNASIIFTITAITTLYFYYWKKDTFTLFQKYFYLFSITLQYFAQLFTYTRAGLIACAVGVTLFLILYYRGKFIIIIPVISTIVPYFLAGFFTAKGFNSFSSRFVLLIPAYYMIIESKTSMLWGYGVTEAFVKYKEYEVIYNVLETNINDPHNTYVSLTIMLGLVFTIMLIVSVIFLFIKSIIKILKLKSQKEKLFYIFLIGVLTSIGTQGLFDSELIVLEYYTIQFLLVFLGITYYSIRKTDIANLLMFNK